MRERLPAVAGTFYERSPELLREQVRRCLAANEVPSERGRFIAAVVPHAGLVYSGHVAAALYARIETPGRAILLGPNHTGLGKGVALDGHDAWSMPFGPVPVDAALRDELSSESDVFEIDSAAHRHEHSLEVQLPFLERSSIVPVCIGDRSFAVCEEIGLSVARVIRRHSGNLAIIASSDLSHYLDQRTTLERDQRVIDRILAMDPEGLHRTVEEEDLSMCGYLPVTAALVAARALGARTATLIKHATSGDVSGDYRSVVGYAALLIA